LLVLKTSQLRIGKWRSVRKLLPAVAAEWLMRRYRSQHFFQVYGMTETGPVGTVLYPEEQLAHAGSIGRSAMPGVRVRLLREDGKDAICGEAGEIWMRADSIMEGYLNDSSATSGAFVDKHWYRTVT
jgi:feruloyl-CoA synthase